MITLKDFLPSNRPVENQVGDLGQFLIENFEDDMGGSEKAAGEGAIEMAVRLLMEYKKIR